jgi:hypothetical protein
MGLDEGSADDALDRAENDEGFLELALNLARSVDGLTREANLGSVGVYTWSVEWPRFNDGFVDESPIPYTPNIEEYVVTFKGEDELLLLLLLTLLMLLLLLLLLGLTGSGPLNSDRNVSPLSSTVMAVEYRLILSRYFLLLLFCCCGSSISISISISFDRDGTLNMGVIPGFGLDS